jgi:hypothetical protein
VVEIGINHFIQNRVHSSQWHAEVIWRVTTSDIRPDLASIIAAECSDAIPPPAELKPPQRRKISFGHG